MSEAINSIVYDIAAVQVLIHALKETVPPADWDQTALPVLAAPKWWLEEVARQMDAGQGEVPQFIHQCPVVEQENLTEPVLITHDEKVYRVRQAIPLLGARENLETVDKVAARLKLVSVDGERLQ